MKVALAQLNPKVGDIEGNLARALAALSRTGPQAPDLVVFSELFLTGYPPQDLLERSWFIERQEKALAELTEAARKYPETGIVIGAALPSRKDSGRGLFSSAVLIYQGRILFQQHKSLLPTYDVFDEARYFDPADKIRTVPFKGRTLGLSVCEDAWNPPDFQPQGKHYTLDPIGVLAEDGADLFINVSASPFHVGKDEQRYRLVNSHAARHGVPFVFVNQVGGNDELVFDGRSMCLDKNGAPVCLCPPFREHVQTIDIDGPGGKGLFEPQDRIESVHQALI
ncbi:MAG: nitrilase-related carbon-nitrogen hydrolase, partial [Thermodesulfobacteriota bacterium]|nr:nitrilase-related carbon-nitrogen hydrolase [Thermodesulfobacteriota bacterium]